MDVRSSRRSWFLVVGLTSLLMLGCGGSSVVYTSEEGRFTIRMPGKPNEDADPEVPSSVKKVTLIQQSGSYTVAWEDLPKKDVDAEAWLDEACNKAVVTLKGKTLSRKRIKLQDKYPGRDLVVEWPDKAGIVNDRMYLVHNRVYHVIASGPKWWVESGESKQVLDSFVLLKE